MHKINIVYWTNIKNHPEVSHMSQYEIKVFDTFFLIIYQRDLNEWQYKNSKNARKKRRFHFINREKSPVRT